MAIQHKSSWSGDGIVQQQAMICPISGQFSQLAAGARRIGVVQFLTSNVDCQAVELSCTVTNIIMYDPQNIVTVTELFALCDVHSLFLFLDSHDFITARCYATQSAVILLFVCLSVTLVDCSGVDIQGA